MGRRVSNKSRIYNTPLVNIKWEHFCRLYITSKEFLGNGTWCYIKSFYLDTNKKGVYNTARSRAVRLLTNVNIRARLKELLEANGFNDSNVQKQHTFLINQYGDLKTKKASVEMYYKLQGRLVDKKEHTIHNIATVLEQIETQR